MDTNTQHLTDELIDRELAGLRRPVEGKRGIGDSVLAMQAAPKRRLPLKWPLGFGSVALAICAMVLFGSLTTANAYAGEFQAISEAAGKQKTMHQKSVIYLENGKPWNIMEFWFDRNLEAYRQYDPDGSLVVARVGDGKRVHSYFGGRLKLGTEWDATVRPEGPGPFSIQTASSLFKRDFYKRNRVVKRVSSYKGKVCDYYDVANGYYRMWVDPVTRLLLKTETYDKGVILYRRDVYEYPDSFKAGTFVPYKYESIKYTEKLPAKKDGGISRAKVGK